MVLSEGVNPLKAVGGKSVPTPSKYQWEQEDVSSSDAGRTEDGVMHKQKLRTVEKISLVWVYLTTAQVSAVLDAFSDEYVNITYLSPAEGKFVERTFYVGNRSAPLYNTVLDRWENISFNIIER